MESITNLNPKNRVDVNISDYDFLKAFKNEGERVYFRLVKEGTNTARNEDCILNLNPDEYPLMQMIFNKYQKQGFAVYFVVNSGGQKKNEITKVTAHFQDMDFGKVPKLDENGLVIKNEMNKTVYEYRSKEQIEQYKQEFIQRVKNLSLSPHIIIETKNGFHVYWLIEQQNEMDLLLFKPLQEALTNYFSQFEARKEHADRSVNNLPKVMRIPNYKHLKNPQDPFTIKCIYFSSHQKKYTQDDIAKAIGIDLTGLKISTTTAKDSRKRSAEQKHLNAPEQVKNSQSESIIDRLRSIDLRQFLGIDCKIYENFKCIFHDDKNPSAVIGCKDGIFRYFCNSTNCQFHNERGLDIIDIVCLQRNCSTADAIKYLINYYKIPVLDSEWETEQRKKIDNNLRILEELHSNKDKYKNANQILQYAYPYLLEILKIGSEHIVNDDYRINGESLFFFSNRYIAKRLKKTLDRVNRYVNLLCALGLLNKISNNELDCNLIKNAEQIAKQKGEYSIRFYTIPDYSTAIDTAEDRAKIMLNYRFSIKGMSRKYIENVFGEEFACKVYSINIECSIRNTAIQEYIETFMLKKIFEQYGYFNKDMLFNIPNYIDGRRIPKQTIEFEYRRCLPEMLDKYDLCAVRVNKDIGERYKITTPKIIIIKNE